MRCIHREGKPPLYSHMVGLSLQTTLRRLLEIIVLTRSPGKNVAFVDIIHKHLGSTCLKIRLQQQKEIFGDTFVQAVRDLHTENNGVLLSESKSDLLKTWRPY